MFNVTLNKLLKVLQLDAENIPEILVTGIGNDSRKILPGNIFVAMVGEYTDGHKYIRDAISNGAVAIIGSRTLSESAVPYFQVADTRLALALLSAAFYDFPSHHLTMIGVTGTDGKTTICNLIHQILNFSGFKTGLISTVNAVIGGEEIDTGFHVTTPEALEVQKFLRKMVDAGLKNAVLESTSHGLEQQRVAACDFDIGVISNITHEHINFHGDYDRYRQAKARLFSGLGEYVLKPEVSTVGAVLNRDDSSYPYLSSVTKVKTLTYGVAKEADFRANEILFNREGVRFNLIYEDFPGNVNVLHVVSPLAGIYNVSNILAALATTIELMQVDPEKALEAVAKFQGIPGRFERIELGQDFLAVVDFAHTPNALKNVLISARTILKNEKKPGRLIAIFGSAGLRDKLKRRMMAEISAKYADLTVLTAEDPRTESLELILEDMAEGMRIYGCEEGQTFWRIPDRGEAIKQAITFAQPGDIVIACGKGHEQSMCFGDIEYAWDDRTAIKAALAVKLGIPGPEMPYLPTRDG